VKERSDGKVCPVGKSLFNPDPGPKSTRAARRIRFTGLAGRRVSVSKYVECEDAAAAAEWDVRLWHRLT
jgi:hypothetical protein